MDAQSNDKKRQSTNSNHVNARFDFEKKQYKSNKSGNQSGKEKEK